MKTILITGVSGFIGSNLLKFYLKNNFFVIGIDNFISSDGSNLIEHENFIFFNKDINDEINYLNEYKIDFILHFACPASPKYYIKYPLETIYTCSFGTKNILDLAKKNNSVILVASTSEIYGDAEISPQKEDYYGNVNTVGTRSCYDESKRFMETLVKTYCEKNKLNYKIIRIFNTYGPGMRLDDGRVITNFIDQINKNIPLTVYGDGNQTRSFCYIDDLIKGIDLTLNSSLNGPLNLGNDEEITINNLIEEIEKILDRKLEKNYVSIDKDDPKKRKPDISLAKEKLGWVPEIKLKEGLKKMLFFSMFI